MPTVFILFWSALTAVEKEITALNILNLEPSVFLSAAQYVPARSTKFNASPGNGSLLITISFSFSFHLIQQHYPLTICYK